MGNKAPRNRKRAQLAAQNSRYRALERRTEAQQVQDKRDLIVQQALAKEKTKPSPWALLRTRIAEPGAFSPRTSAGFDSLSLDPNAADELINMLETAMPRFDPGRYRLHLRALCRGNWVRPASTWEPKGRSAEAQFRSLVAHLYFRYPVPPFLLDAFNYEPSRNRFYDDHPDYYHRRYLRLQEFQIAIGNGASVFKAFAQCVGIPMTKRMVNRFMATVKGTPLMEALRFAQAAEYTDNVVWARALSRVFGGFQPLTDWHNVVAPEKHLLDIEVFWATVIHFFARQGMLDVNAVPPLLDYIKHCYLTIANWSIKGRTVETLTRGMNEWHAELAARKIVKDAQFTPTNFKPLTWDVTDQFGDRLRYGMGEIRSVSELAKEGRALSHCVLSYTDSVSAGRTSIWGLRSWPLVERRVPNPETGEPETFLVELGNFESNQNRHLTVEVDLRLKRVVQIRGKQNRKATAAEMNHVSRWALANDLQITVW